MAKICFYSVATQLGGAERSLLEYLRYVKQETTEGIQLLLPKNNGALLEEVRKLGIQPEVLAMPSALLLGTRRKSLFSQIKVIPATFQYFFQLLRFLRKTQPDIIYTTGIKCHVFGALVGYFLEIPVLWHLRDEIRDFTRNVLQIFYASDNVSAVANSQATARSLSHEKMPAVVYNGIAAEDFPRQRSTMLHDELKLSKNTKIVGIIGVLARWKGQVEFLQMAAQLANIDNLHFVVIGDQIYDTAGDKEYRESLYSLTKTLNLEKRVSFLGFRREVAPLLQSLDVLVHASIEPEPFGRVIIEAMATGTPITASRAGGPLEILRESVDGLFHTPGHSAGMAKNVRKLLEPNFSEKICDSAHRRFLQCFTHHRYNSELHAQLRAAVSSRAKSSESASATTS